MGPYRNRDGDPRTVATENLTWGIAVALVILAVAGAIVYVLQAMHV